MLAAKSLQLACFNPDRDSQVSISQCTAPHAPGTAIALLPLGLLIHGSRRAIITVPPSDLGSGEERRFTGSSTHFIIEIWQILVDHINHSHM